MRWWRGAPLAATGEGAGSHMPRMRRAPRPGRSRFALAPAAAIAGLLSVACPVAAARRLPAVPLPVVTGSAYGLSLLAPGAIRLTASTGAITRRPIVVWATPAGGRPVRLLTIAGSSWHDLWAWQVSGVYLGLWTGLPGSRRPATGDYDTEVAVVDLCTGRIVASTAIYSDDQAYLDGGFLAVSGPYGSEELRRSLAVFDLARGRWLRRVFPPSVENAVLHGGRIYILTTGAHAAPRVTSQPLSGGGWRPAPRSSMVRIRLRRPWPRL